MLLVYTLYFKENEVIIIEEQYISYDDRRNLVNEVLELAKQDKLNNQQKKQLHDIVMDISGTDTQKQRFLLFYNLEEQQDKKYRWCDLQKRYNCTYNAIKSSVNRIAFKLMRADVDKILMLKRMLE